MPINTRCVKLAIKENCCIYRTNKVIEVEDTRVTTAFLITMLSAFIFVFANILNDHQFCDIVNFEPKHYEHTYWWNTQPWHEYKDNNRNVAYCNGSVNTDFWYNPSWQYINNTCGWDLHESDFTSKSRKSLSASTSLGIIDDNGIQSHVIIIPHIEKLSLTWGMSIAIRNYHEIPDIWYKDYKGELKKVPTDNEGRSLISLENLLHGAGISLNDINKFPDDIRNPDTPSEYNQTQISYRISGLHIKAIVDVSNFVFQESLFDKKARAVIEMVVPTDDNLVTWSCSGYRFLSSKDYEVFPKPYDSFCALKQVSFYST